jgi:saccharopine dehydrogenase (NAD+, L-lysine-forming)
VDFARQVGIPESNILRWDMAETAKGGPFKEIVEADIFVNCIYLSKPIPPFVTAETLKLPTRKLEIIVDVSCDTTNPHNPIPIYRENTTFDKPLLHVPIEGAKPVDIIAIDHLPTALPRESSDAFSRDLLPSLLELRNRQNARVWTDAEKLFRQKLALLP